MNQPQVPKWLIPATAVSGLLLVIFFALGIIGGPKQTEPGTTETAGQAIPAHAEIFKVGLQSAANVQPWQGVIRSRTLARIAPKQGARIVEIPVRPGASVKKGDLIVKLDDKDLQAAYQAAAAAATAAQAQAAQAAAEEKRIVDLYQKQAATRQNYDAVIAQAKAARATASQAANGAQQAKAMLGENALLAPFDGVVGERLKDPGDMGMPGETIVTLHQPRDLRLQVAVASHCGPRLAIGAAVTVRLDQSDQQVSGTVDEIAPEIDPQTHTRLLKITLPPVPGLQHGQLGWLQLSCQGERATLLIPTSSVLHFGQLQAVKVIENNRLLTRHIRTGRQSGDQVEVLSGLRDGETILANSELAL